MATMNLFAYDDYPTYIKQKANYIALTPPMIQKLKMITIASEADVSREKNLAKNTSSALQYDALMKCIDIGNVTELEKVIIGCMSQGLMTGKLDQKNKLVYVQSTYGRDVKEDQFNALIAKLEDWDKNLQAAGLMLQDNVIDKCKKSIVDNAKEHKDIFETQNDVKAVIVAKQAQEQEQMGAKMGGMGFMKH